MSWRLQHGHTGLQSWLAAASTAKRSCLGRGAAEPMKCCAHTNEALLGGYSPQVVHWVSQDVVAAMQAVRQNWVTCIPAMMGHDGCCQLS